MKFKYNKFLPLLESFLIIFGTAVMLYLTYGNNFHKINKSFWGSMAIYINCVGTYSYILTNKKVELFDEYFKLSSFFFKGKMKSSAFGIHYEDVYMIKARKIPLFGIWGIQFKANSVPEAITFSNHLLKHKILWKEFTELVMQKNPKADIDENVIKFINKYKTDY